MQNLTKTELISVLDFIFAIKKANDSDTLYKTMQTLAREALRCDELLLGTCSDTGAPGSCHPSPSHDTSAAAARFEAHDPSQSTRSINCGSGCGGGKEPGGESPVTDITSTDDGIMVCNYSAKSPLMCAAFVSQDKNHSPDMELLESLTPYLSAAIDQISSNTLAQRCSKPKDLFLTTREKEILKWVSVGKSCGETGLILGITERTIKFHLQNVYRKLEVVNRAQAVTVAHQHALI